MKYKSCGRFVLKLLMAVMVVSFAQMSQAASEIRTLNGPVEILLGSHLKAGAGNGEIIFASGMFASNVEGFSGVIHDNPHARVLVFEKGIKFALVSLELVNTPDAGIELCKEIVHEKTGTPLENIWVHSNHTITTPHAPSDADEYQLFIDALSTAITEAADEAAQSFQKAVIGIGTGTCDVNANRDIKLDDGNWYYGLGGTLTSNKTMTILRVDTLSGDPIGFLISYGIKPTAIDNVEKSTNSRQISTDVPGLACTMMEDYFGVPAMFAMPATGDQIPKETTTYYEWDTTTSAAILTETTVADGLDIVDRLGTEMGNDAIDIAEKISCSNINKDLGLSENSFTWPAKDGSSDVEVAVGAMSFDDIAFVAIKPETNAVTEQQLQEASPYKHTLMLSFVDGDQKYMPDKDAYGIGTNGSGTVEAQKSGFAQGAAEEFVDTAIGLLDTLKR